MLLPIPQHSSAVNLWKTGGGLISGLPLVLYPDMPYVDFSVFRHWGWVENTSLISCE